MAYEGGDMAAIYGQDLGAWSGRWIDGPKYSYQSASAPTIPKPTRRENGIEVGDRRNGHTERIPGSVAMFLGSVSIQNGQIRT